jgi:hypothetical protein
MHSIMLALVMQALCLARVGIKLLCCRGALGTEMHVCAGMSMEGVGGLVGGRGMMRWPGSRVTKSAATAIV